jgi:hypothetical protein
MDPERVARGIIGVVGLIFSKVFLRAIVLFVVLVFVSSFFPWTRKLYDDIFPQPELRIEQVSPQEATYSDILLGDEWWYQRAVTVENRGNSTANQVHISAVILWGEITRYDIFADYPYTVHSNTDTSAGYLLLTILDPVVKTTKRRK